MKFNDRLYAKWRDCSAHVRTRAGARAVKSDRNRPGDTGAFRRRSVVDVGWSCPAGAMSDRRPSRWSWKPWRPIATVSQW